jgi:methionine--tRNA ligase beta chain
MEQITFDDFQKLDLRVGKIVAAESVEGSEKLLRLEVDLGEEKRQVVAGIAKVHQNPAELVGKNFIVLANLEPRKLMGLESQGMILCADSDDGPVCLTTLKDVSPGTKIR